MPLWVNVSIGGLEGYMLGEFLGRVHKEKLEPQPIDYTEPDPTEAPAISLSGDETPAPDATGMTDSGDEPKGIVIPMDDDGGDSLG